jgi:hypothetical protein
MTVAIANVENTMEKFVMVMEFATVKEVANAILTGMELYVNVKFVKEIVTEMDNVNVTELVYVRLALILRNFAFAH